MIVKSGAEMTIGEGRVVHHGAEQVLLSSSAASAAMRSVTSIERTMYAGRPSNSMRFESDSRLNLGAVLPQMTPAAAVQQLGADSRQRGSQLGHILRRSDLLDGHGEELIRRSSRTGSTAASFTARNRSVSASYTHMGTGLLREQQAVALLELHGVIARLSASSRGLGELVVRELEIRGERFLLHPRHLVSSSIRQLQIRREHLLLRGLRLHLDRLLLELALLLERSRRLREELAAHVHQHGEHDERLDRDEQHLDRTPH